MRLKLADRDGFEPPKCQDQTLVPCHLANGLKVNLTEDTGLERVDRINDHGLANRSNTTLAIFRKFPVTSSGAAQSLRSVSTLRP